jgi:hypothetical protein
VPIYAARACASNEIKLEKHSDFMMFEIASRHKRLVDVVREAGEIMAGDQVLALFGP